MSESLVHLVTALPAEAKPIVSWFKLKRDLPEKGFPVYRNQHISLIVSGVGKTNAAAACGFLQALNGHPVNPIWLNVGVAGHADWDIGDAFLVHHIRDTGSGRQWFPPLAFRLPCPSASLHTLDLPDFSYEQDHALDMEASGFYPSALRFSTAELVHCLKVVSDNAKHPGHGLDAKSVQVLIGSQLDLLDDLLGRLGFLANQLHDAQVAPEIIERYRRHCRFSESQQHQLTELLARWQTLQPSSDLWVAELDGIRQSRPLLAHLRRHLETLPLQL